MNNNLKLVFICSPNNPSGNLIHKSAIEKFLRKFNGIIILDEAYIDFCPSASFLPALKKYPNLVILQTLSKAWGMAGARLGIAFASEEIIGVFNKIKYPYNINVLTQTYAAETLKNEKNKHHLVGKILEQKKILMDHLSDLKVVNELFPSDANFLLVKFLNAQKIFEHLKKNGIIVRDRSKEVNCENCLRITVGTETENRKLIQTLKNYKS